MSNTRKTMALEFIKGNGRKLAHSSVELRYPLGAPNEYRLHGNVIASFYPDEGKRTVTFDWCGWYTPTTAAHMNEILRAMGSTIRVSYSQARNSGATTFTEQVQA